MIKRILLLTILMMSPLAMSPKIYGETDEPSITSETAVLMDAKTGAILYEKNAEQAMYPASLTKIATAIYAIENGNLEDVVTVSENAIDVEGTTVFLEEGEQVPLKKLIQGLLINSGNDAGVAIAEHLSGSVEQFSKDINAYLRNTVGVKNTTFKNPHGLFNYEHVTTAEDLAFITKYALQNELFREIFGTVQLDWAGKSWDTTLISHHKMLKGEITYDEVTGGKTGYVDQSGHTLATSASGNRIHLIAITMRSNTQTEAYSDTATLLDYGLANFETAVLEGGSVVEVNNQGYQIPSEVYYTKRIGEEMQYSVTPNGELQFSDENEEVMGSYPLEAIAKKENVLAAKDKINESSPLKSTLLYAGIGIIGFLIIAALLQKKKRRRSRQFYGQM